MDGTRNYVVDSLELHLFFARIMKEHSFFLKVGFLPPNANMAGEAEVFLRQFERLLSRAIGLSNNMVRCCVLNSGKFSRSSPLRPSARPSASPAPSLTSG